MDVREFQEKLKEIQALAHRQENSLTAAQIREVFGEAGLDRSQMAGVLRYLDSQGIYIEGNGNAAQSGSAAQTGPDAQNGTAASEAPQPLPLTPEEQAYLKEYLETLPSADAFPASDLLFENLAKGSADAAQTLAAKYMKAAADLAVEKNIEELAIADLIQEANLSLIQALGNAGTELRGEEWLLDQVRNGLAAACQEQTRQKFADDSLVARVEKLEQAVRDLSDDEEDGKSAFSVGELAVILDMDVEEIRDILRLTGDDVNGDDATGDNPTGGDMNGANSSNTTPRR